MSFPGAAVPGCASVAPACHSPVLPVSARPSVSFGELRRGTLAKRSFFSGAGPGRGRLAGGCGVPAAGSRCAAARLLYAAPFRGPFRRSSAGARAGMAFFRSSTEGARGQAAGDNRTRGVGRGARDGGGRTEIAMCPTSHILSGPEGRSSGRRAASFPGMRAAIVIFSHFVPPG